MKKSRIFQVKTKDLLDKAQEIINITPELSLKYALLADKRASYKEKELYFGIFNKILGECYYLLNNYHLAKQYVFSAREFYYRGKDLKAKMKINFLLAKIYLKNGENEKAVELYHEMLISSNSLSFSKGTLLTLNEMATLYLQIGQYDMAYEVISTLGSEDIQILSKETQLKILSTKITAFIKCNITKGLEDILNKAYSIAKDLGDNKSLKQCYENFYLYYKLIDNIPQAFKYLEKSHTLSENSNKAISFTKIAQLLNQYEIDKQKDQLIHSEEELKALANAYKVIKKQNNFLQIILETIPNPVFYKDLQGRYIGYNKKWSDLFLPSSSKRKINTISEIVPPDIAKLVFNDDNELLYQRSLLKKEYKVQLADKKEHTCVVYKDVFRDEGGGIDGIIGVVNDITDYKTTLLELSKSNNHLHTLLENAPIGICIFDNNGWIEKSNCYFNLLLAIPTPKSQINFFDFILPKDLELVKKNLLDHKETKKVAFSENRLVDFNGTIIHVELSSISITNPDTNNPSFMVIINNITEKKITEENLRKSERKLREANLTKDKFFSIIAHDLREPIGNYREIFKLLASKSKVFPDKERMKLMEQMYYSADYTFDLLENLLQWTRSQKNELKITPNYHSLCEVFNKVTNSFKALLDNKNISIVNNIDPYHIGYFDIKMITTVARNLISNAIKFSYENSKITISSQLHDKEISVSIIDNGVGISQARIKTIFSFKDLSSTRGTNKEKGTGLGLVLCKNFIELNHGTISVSSQEKHGSTFTFTLLTSNEDFN